MTKHLIFETQTELTSVAIEFPVEISGRNKINIIQFMTMAQCVEKFIEEFHTLEGVTISEKKRSLFKLLNTNKNLKANPESLEKILTNLTPNSHLENLFRIQVYIFFRKTKNLLEVLKENDRIFVNFKKLNWFFAEILLKNEVEILDLLPQISFSTRIKLLNGLSSQNDHKLDKLFDLITARYAISFSSKFIKGCSVEKAKEIVKLHPVELSSKILINFHKKDKTFIEFYFEAFDDHENCHLTCKNYKSLYRYIFKNDIDLFFRLKDTYKTWRHKLGKKLTSKFVSLKKDEIITKPNNYRDLLHLEIVFKMLKFEETKLLIKNSLPEKLSSLRYLDVESFLNLYPTKIRFQVLESVISQRYKVDLSTQPNLISPRLLASVDNSAKRHKIAKFLVEEGDDDYIKYMNLEESIPKLKTKINSCKVAKDRKKFIRNLVDTCKINNNQEIILKILKYSQILDKNGDQNELISCIHHKFGLQNLSQEMWDQINEMIKIQKIKDGTEINDEIQLAHLEFSHKTNKPNFDELLKTYISTNYKYLNLWTKHQNPEFSQFLINIVIEKAPEIVQVDDINDDEDLKRLDLKIIELITTYNEKNPKTRINFQNHQRLVQTFRWSLNENKQNSTIHKIIKEKVLDNKCSDRKDYMQIFWSHMELNTDFQALNWFLKYDPETVSKYFNDNLARALVELGDKNLWEIIKKYHHLELDSKFIDFCLRTSAETSIKAKVIECLSHLMSPEQYLELADRFKQDDPKCSQIRGVVASNFKNLECYRKILTQFLSFYCTGDYFKYASISLGKMLCHIPEKLLPRYLHQLASNKNSSVRKFALHFTCELCDLTQIESILETLHNQSQNGHKSNLKTLTKYFYKNPSSDIYELIKISISGVYGEDNDKVFDSFTRIQQIPLKFRANYVEFLWKFLENSLVPSHRQNFLRQLLNDITIRLDENISKDLTLKFGTKIIKHNLFNCIDSHLEGGNIKKLTKTLLKVHPNKMELLKLVLDILNQPTLITKSEILEFLFIDCYDIIMQTTKDHEFVEIYINHIIKLNIKPTESFSNYLRIFFLKMRQDFLTEPITVESFAEKIVKFFRELVTKYGPYILDLFAKAVNDNVHYFCVDNIVSEYHYYEGLIKLHPNDYSVGALVLQLTLSSPRLLRWEKPIRENIIQLLKLVQDPGIEIIVRNRLLL